MESERQPWLLRGTILAIALLVAASAVPPHAKEGDGVGRFLTVPLASAQELCGRPWDWIEAIGPAG